MSATVRASPYAIAPHAQRPLRRGFDFGASLRWPALAASLLLLGSVGATLAQPVLVSWVIDHGVLQNDTDALRSNVLLLLGAVVAEAVLTAGHLWLFAWVGERYLALLRNRVFEHLSDLSLFFYDAHSTGELISRASDDVQTLAAFVRTGMSSLLTGVLLLALGIVVMASLSLPLLAVSLVVVPMLWWLSRRFLHVAEPRQRRYLERYAAALSVIEQGLSGARLLHLYRRQRAWADSVDRRLDDQYRARMQRVRARNRFLPWLQFTWVFVTAATIGAGAGLNSVGMVTIGVASAFVLSLTRIFGPVENLSRLLGNAQSAKAALGRVFALLVVPLDVRERPGAVELASRGNLEASGVTFSYTPGRPVLTDVSLCVQPGETLVLVGPTGAGKSTLARLLARLYDPDQGRISFGGLDLKDGCLASVRRRIVLLPQEGHLFSGTVADNIRLSRPEASDAEIARTVSDLGLDEQFSRFSDGLLTEVDGGGTRLSAGERQLVSLARVVLVNPEVAILDEALSNVDPGTEALVQRAMRRLMEGRTVIVIAHRETTAQRADRVAFLDDGVLAAQGRHDTLLRHSSDYVGLWGGLNELTPTSIKPVVPIVKSPTQ
ncbi:MAG: ABC transporter ATP-binding protein [Chloroflexota bacterium]|nr:ABC transporter ATP-binding protein [Chloroflexota bacterium]